MLAPRALCCLLTTAAAATGAGTLPGSAVRTSHEQFGALPGSIADTTPIAGGPAHDGQRCSAGVKSPQSSPLDLITTSLRQVVAGRYTSVAEGTNTEHIHQHIANLKQYTVKEGEGKNWEFGRNVAGVCIFWDFRV